MEALNESFVDVFNQNKTGISFYDDVIDPKQKDYMKFEKGTVGRIEKMTAKQYFEVISKEVFGCTVSQARKGLSSSKIDKYSKMMKDGVKFNIPYINLHPYFGPSQEGRHRMAAMAKAFGEDAEGYVLVVEPYVPDDKEIREYASKSSFPDWKVDYVNQMLDKYLDRHREDKDESPEEEEEETIIKIPAIEITRGDTVNLGDGWAKVTNYDLSDSKGIKIFANLVDSNKEVEYFVKDFDKVKVRV